MKKAFTIVEVSILFVIFLIVAFLVAPLSLDDSLQAKNASRWRNVQSDFANIFYAVNTQKEDKNFDFKTAFEEVINGEVKTIESQRHVRFYVSLNGVIIYKKHKTTEAKSVLASGLPVTILNSLDDKSIEERGIDYKYYYNEAYKIINPIKLGISPNRKGDSNKKLLSGKVMLKRNFGLYNSLFDDETSE